MTYIAALSNLDAFEFERVSSGYRKDFAFMRVIAVHRIVTLD